MRLDKKEDVKKIGLILGFIFAYFIFTTILYFLLFFLKKLPSNWGYFHLAVLTLFITLLGFLTRLLLK